MQFTIMVTGVLLEIVSNFWDNEGYISCGQLVNYANTKAMNLKMLSTADLLMFPANYCNYNKRTL